MSEHHPLGTNALSENLRVLRSRHPALAAELERAGRDEVEEEVGPRGATTLKHRGIRLGSAYDPEAEGRRLAEEMATQPADVMVAVGFGLGEQFAPYLEANPATLVIFEPSLERLRAALERTSIAELLRDNEDLYLATDPSMLTRLVAARYAPGLRLRVFPHPAVLRLDREAVLEATRSILETKENVDTQRMTSIEMLAPWALVTARNGERIARSPQLGRLKDRFEGRPAVVAAAGPSLDKQLPLLREIQDRVVVVAIGQTAKALISAGIRPDVIHILESRDVSHQLTDCGDTSDLIVAPSADADPAIFDVPCRARFTVTPLGGEMGVWIGRATGEQNFSMGGGTVAQGAVGVALLLGCNPISLIGQDLAFTDGRVYASQSAYDFVGVDFSEDGECQFTNSRQKVALLGEKDRAAVNQVAPSRRVVWVDGWNEGEKVPTWRAYASFIDQYREIGLLLKSNGGRLINCTEGGARIPEIEHRTFRDFADEFAREAFDARSEIVGEYDSAPRYRLEDYREAIEEAREVLSQIEKDARKGARFCAKKREALLSTTDASHRVRILRGIARFERRVRRQLDRVPWLDALVQPEIYNSIAAARRTERQRPTDEHLIEESEFLFAVARNGIGRARHWFEEFEASFAESLPTSDGATRARPVRGGEEGAAAGSFQTA